MSVPRGPLWPSLRAAADAFSPPFEIVAESPGKLALEMRAADSGDEVRLRYRSERGLFLRTYYLVVEAAIPGGGPTEPGTLVLRRRKLRWKRPQPHGGVAWSESFDSPDVRAALKPLQIERLRLTWYPDEAIWKLALETLSGSVTATFFPPLMTPNPFERKEAQAVEALLRALKRVPARTRA